MRLSRYIAVAALACSACGDDSRDPFNIDDATVESVRSALASGSVTCRSLTELSLARIASLNRQGAELRAVLEVNPDALALADALDRAYAQSGPVGPLHCVPMLVKDNFNTGDGMATTAGSLVMQGFRAPQDALAVAKLRAAGALPIAKTHMDEWAQGAAGYGSRGGQMLNAHKRNRIPGGRAAARRSASRPPWARSPPDPTPGDRYAFRPRSTASSASSPRWVSLAARESFRRRTSSTCPGRSRARWPMPLPCSAS
jgi:hypothetical protein